MDVTINILEQEVTLKVLCTFEGNNTILPDGKTFTFFIFLVAILSDVFETLFENNIQQP